MIKVNEIFHSIQGESSFAGLRCIFIRLTYCNLRCSYCDTEYAFNEGSDMTIEEIMLKIKKYECDLVEVTGGEPLFQEETKKLLTVLCDEGYKTLLETSGSLPIKNVDKRVIIVMDIKTPSSKMAKKNLWDNINYLKPEDEVKFVLGSVEDYIWMKEIIEKYNLESSRIIVSPVFNTINYEDLANWILKDNLKVRMQIQLHKIIWSPDKRGV